MAETLKPEWELFVNEYLVDLNATRAAKRAGFGNTDEAIKVTASRLLTKANIKRAIRKEFKKRLKRVEITQDRVIQELALVALSDILDYEVNEATGRLIPLSGRRASKAVQSVKIKRTRWTDKDGNSTDEVTTELKLWDKVRAIELLMKHMGMLDGDVKQEPLSTDERRSRGAAGLKQILERRRASVN